MTYGTIPRARGIAVGDPAVIILTGEPVKILRIEARDVRREVRVYFEVSAAGEQPGSQEGRRDLAMSDLVSSLIQAAAWYLNQRPMDGSAEDERLRGLGIRLRQSADDYARTHLQDEVTGYGGNRLATVYRSRAFRGRYRC